MNKSTIERLQKQYGDAFFIFDEDQYIKNINDVSTAFEKKYKNLQLAYSFKTNYVPRVCRLAKDHNVLAEVVSEMEYQLALKVGYKPEQIIYNGPIKTRESLFRAFENDSVIHFDSDIEIEYLEEYLSVPRKKTVRCALRCNFNIQGEDTSRFGFDGEDGTVEKIYERLFNLEGCEPIGIHCHLSTSSRSLKSFEERTQKIIALAKKIFKNRKPDYIDVGGGFFGNMPQDLVEQFSFKVPNFDEYAEVVAGQMRDNFPQQDIKLILEPGSMLVADTTKFYCKVYDLKKIREKEFVMVHGSIHNTKPTGKSRVLPSFDIISMNAGQKHKVKNADITGYTCIEYDVLAYGISGEIAIGDYLEFNNVGAYSMMYKPPFIKGQPYILSKKENEYQVIKENETLDHIFATYKF
jgi:diaminopimelate decarboxylase